MARNEEAVVSPIEQIGYLRNKYFSHLNYVVMVDSRTLIPERLGGADFDGDMVKTIADPLLNKCVTRNYKHILVVFIIIVRITNNTELVFVFEKLFYGLFRIGFLVVYFYGRISDVL